jgi:hypothetical protein
MFVGNGYLSNWFCAKASPDFLNYYNNIDTTGAARCWGGGGMRIPNSVYGFQYPRTDSCYVGLATYFSEQQNNWAGHTYKYREWIGVKLLDTLKQGKCYEFKMYISRGEKSNRIISSIGAYFSPDSLFEAYTDTSPFYISPWPLDSELVQIQHNPWETIYDTTDWLEITGIFNANGNEEYLYLGNFLNDEQYPIVMIDTLQSNPFCQISYFFIDDVSLYEIDEPCGVGINENIVSKIKIYPNPAQDFVSIELPKNYNQAQLSIYNLTGQLVLQKQIIQPNQTMPITELGNGMYIFVVESGDRVVWRERVVISK